MRSGNKDSTSTNLGKWERSSRDDVEEMAWGWKVSWCVDENVCQSAQFPSVWLCEWEVSSVCVHDSGCVCGGLSRRAAGHASRLLYLDTEEVN